MTLRRWSVEADTADLQEKLKSHAFETTRRQKYPGTPARTALRGCSPSTHGESLRSEGPDGVHRSMPKTLPTRRWLVVAEETVETPFGGFLSRMAWTFGCGVLLLLLVSIAMNDNARLSPLSIGFWVGVCIVIGARYLDVFYCADVSHDDTHAPLRSANQFSAGLIAIAGAAWLIVHAV